MKKTVLCLTLLLAVVLGGCGVKAEEAGWPGHEGFYATGLKYSGENESDARYLEIARKSGTLLPLLEETGAAVFCRPLGGKLTTYPPKTADGRGSVDRGRAFLYSGAIRLPEGRRGVFL